MKRLSKKLNRARSVQRLVRIALRCWDSDEGWRAIVELQMRGSAQTLANATALMRSSSWRRRSVGIYIVSQLGQIRGASSTEYALAETHNFLLAGLHDPHIEVVRAAVSGLGHRPHPAALDDLVRLSLHRDDRLRWHVAISLGRYEEPAAIEALLRLATDPDDGVRDWATFGLGSIQSSDTPEIRAALWRNLRDKDDGVRGEALVGLAERHDERAVQYLLEHLNSNCQFYELDAARKLADPRLLDTLQALSNGLSEEERGGYWFNCLQAAIDACR